MVDSVNKAPPPPPPSPSWRSGLLLVAAANAVVALVRDSTIRQVENSFLCSAGKLGGRGHRGHAARVASRLCGCCVGAQIA